jgi:hypothetical protein
MRWPLMLLCAACTGIALCEVGIVRWSNACCVWCLDVPVDLVLLFCVCRSVCWWSVILSKHLVWLLPESYLLSAAAAAAETELKQCGVHLASSSDAWLVGAIDGM